MNIHIGMGKNMVQKTIGGYSEIHQRICVLCDGYTTPVPQAMKMFPECMVEGDTVQAYRNLHGCKRSFATWKNRPIPTWFKTQNQNDTMIGCFGNLDKKIHLKDDPMKTDVKRRDVEENCCRYARGNHALQKTVVLTPRTTNSITKNEPIYSSSELEQMDTSFIIWRLIRQR